MKRFAVILLTALTGVPLSAAAVSAATKRAPVAPRAQFKAFVCRTAVLPAKRAFSVAAVMRPVPRTETMAIRFDLLRRTRGASQYARVHGGLLGSFQTPTPADLGQRPGDMWTLYLPAVDLSAPATYRYRVTFRWTGKHDHVLATRTYLTARCVQPELRPDLLVASIVVTAVAGHPRQNQYTALVENRGASAAGPFEVVFTPGGPFPLDTRIVQRLDPHGARAETFPGPACTAASAPSVTVDPTRQVDDFNPANNSLRAVCPLPPSAP